MNTFNCKVTCHRFRTDEISYIFFLITNIIIKHYRLAKLPRVYSSPNLEFVQVRSYWFFCESFLYVSCLIQIIVCFIKVVRKFVWNKMQILSEIKKNHSWNLFVAIFFRSFSCSSSEFGIRETTNEMISGILLKMKCECTNHARLWFPCTWHSLSISNIDHSITWKILSSWCMLEIGNRSGFHHSYNRHVISSHMVYENYAAFIQNRFFSIEWLKNADRAIFFDVRLMAINIVLFEATDDNDLTIKYKNAQRSMCDAIHPHAMWYKRTENVQLYILI